LGNQQPQSEEG